MSKFLTLRMVSPSSFERMLTITEDRLVVLDAILNDND